MKILQKNKTILILGLGIEGLDTYIFLRKNFPKKNLILADKKNLSDFDEAVQKKFKKDKYLELQLGENYLSKLKDIDIVIKTAGIPLSAIKKYFNKKTIFTSQTEIFFNNCPARIIGITGTKGKSTTSSLIYSLLKTSKKKTYLLGNIGTAPLSFLSRIKKDDLIVYELSAHQLQNLQTSPYIAIFLNIYPEHLDYYKTFKEYFNAKSNIALHQKKTDYFIFNADIKEIKNLSAKTNSKKIPIDAKKYQDIISNSNIGNLTHSYNISAVLEVAKILRIADTAIKKTFKNFSPPCHRLEYIGEFNGITFYDDSIATIPESVIFALDKLGEKVETLIVGGLNRGIKFDKIAKRIIKSKIKNLILFPESGKNIKDEINRLDKDNHFVFYETSDMKDAISFAFKNTEKGKICLLSPASPSFNLFKDYQERGNLFEKHIKEYED